MPLLKGKKNVGKNIKTEMKHGKSRKQAIAIAMDVAGMSKKKKGKKNVKQMMAMKKREGMKKMKMLVKNKSKKQTA